MVMTRLTHSSHTPREERKTRRNAVFSADINMPMSDVAHCSIRSMSQTSVSVSWKAAKQSWRLDLPNPSAPSPRNEYSVCTYNRGHCGLNPPVSPPPDEHCCKTYLARVLVLLESKSSESEASGGQEATSTASAGAGAVPLKGKVREQRHEEEHRADRRPCLRAAEKSWAG